MTVGGKLSYRLAESPEDLAFLVPASLEFHGEGRFRDIPYSLDKRDKVFRNAIDDPKRYGLLIAEFDGDPVGFLFCSVGEYMVGTGDLLTTVYSFYVRKKYRGTLLGGKAAVRLLASAVKWSEARQAREIMIHVTSGIDIQRTDRFLRRAHFNVVGANYALSLSGRGSDGAQTNDA